MKRAMIIFTLFLMASTLPATSAAAQARDAMEGRVFNITHQDARAIAGTIRLLGTRGEGSDLSVNEELNTITIRDYPEKIATMEAAIQRLDVPSAAAKAIRLQLYVLVGSSGAGSSGDVPPVLADVVQELESALRYTSYSLMTSALHQTRAGQGIEGSGVADAEMVQVEVAAPAPLVYSYTLQGIDVISRNEQVAVDVRNFGFSMKFPIQQGGSIQYLNVGFDTPVMIREGERVVVGTTAMGDKALIVVVTARVGDE